MQRGSGEYQQHRHEHEREHDHGHEHEHGHELGGQHQHWERERQQLVLILLVVRQWAGSPKPNQHDILTGTNLDGTVVPGKTCADWTSEDSAMFAWVGHSDGLGPNMSMEPMYRPWNSVHENGGCHDTAPKGGAGRIYCFATN